MEPIEAPIGPDDSTQIPEGDPGSFTNPVPLGVGVTFTIAKVDDLAIFFATDPATLYLESDVAAIAPAAAWRDIVDLQRASIAGIAIVLIPNGATGVWAINPVGTDLIVYVATQ